MAMTGHVREQVDHRDQQPGDDADAHDQGGVQPLQPEQQVGAQPGHGEDHLDHSHAGEETSEVQGQDRQQRQKGIREQMPPAYRPGAFAERLTEGDVGLLLLLQQRGPQQPSQHQPEGHTQRQHR